MANTKLTPKSKIPYWVENGKLTIDGYCFYNSMFELEKEIAWEIKWSNCEASKDENGNWVAA